MKQTNEPDALRFEQRAREEPRLRALLDAVGGEVARGVAADAPARYVSGADVFFGLAAYALFRWVKDTLDHRRGRNQAELLAQHARVIAALIADGFPPREARATVVALRDAIAGRAADDPVLEMVFSLVGKEG